MAHEIDLRMLKQASEAILDHIITDLGIDRLSIKEDSDFYWEVPSDRLYTTRESQPDLDIGRVTDDWEFIRGMLSEPNGAVALMLIHMAPLLRYLGETIGE